MAKYSMARLSVLDTKGKGKIVAHKIVLFILLGLVVSLSGCRIKKAVDELENDMDDAYKTDGDEACEQVLEDLYSRLDGCTEQGALQEGQTAYDAAFEWCSGCDDLDEKVEPSDVSGCQSAIGSLECDALDGVLDLGSALPAECNWLPGDLDC